MTAVACSYFCSHMAETIKLAELEQNNRIAPERE
jgi:hypothetical protein